jgi:hypothetical protein
MDGDTPIDCFLPQFSQREASDLAGVDTATINNWLQRGDFKLAEPGDRRLRGRRFFSVADIAALHTMDFCVKALDMRPGAAAIAGRIVHRAFGEAAFGEKREDGRVFEFWHLMHRTPFQTIGDEDGWTTQGVWQDRQSGAFFEYDPIIYPNEEPFGLPHFPCLSIPTSEILRRIFLKCADHLRGDEGDK